VTTTLTPDLLAPVRITTPADQAGTFLAQRSVNAVVTSPPYWKKRKYGHPDELGWEKTPELFVERLLGIMDSWVPLLAPSASVFVNLADTRKDGALAGVITTFERKALERGWTLAHHIQWLKRYGVPTPHQMLAERHESIWHFGWQDEPFVDLEAYGRHHPLEQGDAWEVKHTRTKSKHLAAWPIELPTRLLRLGCPERVCQACSAPTPCPDHHWGETPALVLDPFAGSGTTLQAAQQLGLRSVGLDLMDWA